MLGVSIRAVKSHLRGPSPRQASVSLPTESCRRVWVWLMISQKGTGVPFFKSEGITMKIQISNCAPSCPLLTDNWFHSCVRYVADKKPSCPAQSRRMPTARIDETDEFLLAFRYGCAGL